MPHDHEHDHPHHHEHMGVFFIPGGVLLGIGLGLLFHASSAWILIGLGFGFVGWAILDTLKR